MGLLRLRLLLLRLPPLPLLRLPLPPLLLLLQLRRLPLQPLLLPRLLAVHAVDQQVFDHFQRLLGLLVPFCSFGLFCVESVADAHEAVDHHVGLLEVGVPIPHQILEDFPAFVLEVEDAEPDHVLDLFDFLDDLLLVRQLHL